jgi:DNA-binding NarL/FixJ family response regulator
MRKSQAVSPISVLLVDDHRLFLDGLRRILDGQGDLKVAAEADSIARAVEQARMLQPDLTLLDLGLKDGSGLDALTRILEAAPSTQVIVVSGYGPENVLPSLRGGARGFVSKDTASSNLLRAIRAVLRGEIWADPQTTGQLVSALLQTRQEPQSEEGLTAREQDVLGLVGEGKRNPEIAQALGISENTVKTHIKSLLRKLEVEDRVQLALHSARSRRSVR